MQDITKQFREKINSDFNQYMNDAAAMSKEEIIEDISRIAEIKRLHQELTKNSFNEDYLAYFNKFQHPLYIIHDEWMCGTVDISNDLEYTLWNISDKELANEDYELDQEMCDQKGSMEME